MHYNYFRDYDPSIGRYIQSDPIGLDGGLSTYGYAGSRPLGAIDPLGLYWGKVHHQITQAAAEIAKLGCANLARDTAMADWVAGSQAARNSHWHAMRDGTDPAYYPGKATKKYEQFIDSQIKTCTCGGLARALHAVQDSFASGHSGFQPWGNGPPSLSHIQGDRNPSLDERQRATDASVELIKRYKKECSACPLL